MKIECTDKKTFQLKDNEQILASLTYKNFFSFEAEARLSDSDRYEIKPAGFFGTSITVTKNTAEIANLKMNWSGHIVLTFQNGIEYILKSKGTFHNKYVMENKDKEKIIQFDPKLNWGKSNYDYEISYEQKPTDILFILLGVYASNYYTAMMSSIIAGTV